MKKEQIIYKDDGTVDFEKSVKEGIKALEARDGSKRYKAIMEELSQKVEALSGSDLPDITEELQLLILAVANEDCHAVGMFYGSQEKTFDTLPNISYYEAENINEYVVERFIKGLCGIEDRYTSKITLGGLTIYENENMTTDKYVSIFDKFAQLYGKFAAKAFAERAIYRLDRSVSWNEVDRSERLSLLNGVLPLFDETAKLVYPQRVNELAEYLLLNATVPDNGEDMYDTGLTYRVAAQILKMINEDKKLSEIVKEVKSLSWPFDTYLVTSFLLRFGKEKGVQVFEKLFIKPAEKNKEGHVTFLDYNIAKIDKYKAFIKEIREENQKFEEELALK